MRNRSKFGRTGLSHLLVAFLLSVAVFGWGLRYKLSLYHTTAVQGQHMAAARLLSQNKRAQAAAAPQKEKSPSAVASMLWVGAALFLLSLHERRDRVRAKTVPPTKPPILRFFALFFRPPPPTAFPLPLA